MTVDTIPALPLTRDPCYVQLKQLIIERSGLAYYEQHEPDLIQKIQTRLDALQMQECSSYLELLTDKKTGESEFDTLIETLTICETHFFRHNELFDAVRDIVLPGVVQRNRDIRRIRIWSAGCSIGAEAYSMSILLREYLADEADTWDISIVGTDINRNCLATARRGVFDEWALRSLPQPVRERYFTHHGAQWHISPDFCRQVSFQHHNLVEQPFPSLIKNQTAFDVILCRNVMIYFNDAVRRRLAASFQGALLDGGWLLVGHSEPQEELFGQFKRVVAKGAILYQNNTDCSEAPPPFIDTIYPLGSCLKEHLPLITPPAESTPRMVPKRLQSIAPLLAVTDRLRVDAPSLETVRTLADRGQLTSAVRVCAELVQTRQLCPNVNFHMALLLDQIGHNDEAEKWLRKTLFLDHGFVPAHYLLGLTCLRRSDTTAAIRSFATTLRLTTDTPKDLLIDVLQQISIGELRQLAAMHLSLISES